MRANSIYDGSKYTSKGQNAPQERSASSGNCVSPTDYASLFSNRINDTGLPRSVAEEHIKMLGIANKHLLRENFFLKNSIIFTYKSMIKYLPTIPGFPALPENVRCNPNGCSTEDADQIDAAINGIRDMLLNCAKTVMDAPPTENLSLTKERTRHSGYTGSLSVSPIKPDFSNLSSDREMGQASSSHSDFNYLSPSGSSDLTGDSLPQHSRRDHEPSAADSVPPDSSSYFADISNSCVDSPVKRKTLRRIISIKNRLNKKFNSENDHSQVEMFPSHNIFKPIAVRPQPIAVRPQPIAVRPQPIAVRPQPIAARPQPIAVRPQPIAARPQTVDSSSFSSADETDGSLPISRKERRRASVRRRNNAFSLNVTKVSKLGVQNHISTKIDEPIPEISRNGNSTDPTTEELESRSNTPNTEPPKKNGTDNEMDFNMTSFGGSIEFMNSLQYESDDYVGKSATNKPEVQNVDPKLNLFDKNTLTTDEHKVKLFDWKSSSVCRDTVSNYAPETHKLKSQKIGIDKNLRFTQALKMFASKKNDKDVSSLNKQESQTLVSNLNYVDKSKPSTNAPAYRIIVPKPTVDKNLKFFGSLPSDSVTTSKKQLKDSQTNDTLQMLFCSDKSERETLVSKFNGKENEQCADNSEEKTLHPESNEDENIPFSNRPKKTTYSISKTDETNDKGGIPSDDEQEKNIRYLKSNAVETIPSSNQSKNGTTDSISKADETDDEGDIPSDDTPKEKISDLKSNVFENIISSNIPSKKTMGSKANADKNEDDGNLKSDDKPEDSALESKLNVVKNTPPTDKLEKKILDSKSHEENVTSVINLEEKDSKLEGLGESLLKSKQNPPIIKKEPLGELDDGSWMNRRLSHPCNSPSFRTDRRRQAARNELESEDEFFDQENKMPEGFCKKRKQDRLSGELEVKQRKRQRRYSE